MVGDALVGNVQSRAFLHCRFLQKESSQPLVKAFPHDLLHQPHEIGQMVGDQVVGVVCHGDGLVHQVFVQAGRNDPKLRILLRLDEDVVVHAGHDAGCGKQANIHFKKTAQGDLPPLVAEEIGSELTLLHQNHAQTVRASVVEQSTAGYNAVVGGVFDALTLFLGELVPNGKILFDHGAASFAAT